MKLKITILAIALAAMTATTTLAASIKDARPTATKRTAGKPKMPSLPR